MLVDGPEQVQPAVRERASVRVLARLCLLLHTRGPPLSPPPRAPSRINVSCSPCSRHGRPPAPAAPCSRHGCGQPTNQGRTGRDDQGKGNWLQQKQWKIHDASAYVAPGSDYAGKPTQDGATITKMLHSDNNVTADSLRLAASQGNKGLVKDYVSRMAEASSGNAS